MKLNTLIRSALFGAALSASSLFANVVTIEDTIFDGNIGGGEFKAITDNHGTFYTFCLEAEVHVDVIFPGNTYTYTVDLDAKNQGDVLSVGSAWLYEKFFSGNLSGSAPATSYWDDRDVNAGLLQKAFWALENEAGGANNYYTTLAITHFGSLAAARADITATSKVKVMNLWGANGEDVQSQLIYVPDSGMTALLLGLGLLSLAAFRRKL